MGPQIEITKLKVFDYPKLLPSDHNSIAWFNFLYAGVEFCATYLRVTPNGSPRVDLYRPRTNNTRPAIFRDRDVARAITDAAVRAYFAAGGLYLDAAHIERHGYSGRIGVDGFPLDPRHPFNRESAA